MRIVRTRRIVLIALIVALASPAALAQQALKVGVFNAEQASLQTTAGQELHRRLTEQGRELETELRGLQEQLNTLTQDYQANSLSLSEDKRKDMEREIERRQIEFQSKQQAFLRERQRDVTEAQEEWAVQVRDAVMAIGREGAYDLLIPSELVPFYSQAVDITDQLVDRLGRAETPAPEAAGGSGE